MRTIIVTTCILVIIFVISGTEGTNYIETALFIKLTCHVLLGDCPQQDCRVLQNIASIVRKYNVTAAILFLYSFYS